MSFLYPRTVAITRPTMLPGVGAVGSGGTTLANEVAVASGIPASIQLEKGGGRRGPGLPGDTSKHTFWRVLIPLSAVAQGTIQTWDVVTDDLNARYQVMGPYWNSLGYNLEVERLET